MSTIAAVIPAKGTSARVPAKNLQKVLEVPLVLWAANNLSRVLPQTSIYIDSEADEILQLAERNGFRTLRRPESLASNDTDGNQLMLWQAAQTRADILIQHLPPMIFLKEETIRRALDAVQQRNFDSAFGLFSRHMYLWNDSGPLYDIRNLPNSTALPTTCVEGMGFYIAKRDALEREKVRVCGKSFKVELDCFEAIDIDTPLELEYARTMATGLGFNSPYTAGIARYATHGPIRLVVLDVDGVMSDGGMYYSESGDQLKRFDTKDGLSIKELISAGIEVRFLSSGSAKNIIQARADTLGVAVTHCGSEPKVEIFRKWIAELGLAKHEIAYIADDRNDLEALLLAGVRACPSDAAPEIKKIASIVLDSAGGNGCVREFVDRCIFSRTKI